METQHKENRKPMPQVSKVIPLKNYKLLLVFTTNEIKLYDASWVLKHPITKILKDPSVFNKAYVSNGTVVWDDQLDLGPDDLYDNSKDITDINGTKLIAG